MSSKISVLVIAGLLVCLGILAPATQAQEKCSLQTFAGTYVVYGKGASVVADLTAQPYPFHWWEAAAPFVFVAQLTMTGNGTGDGYYWIKIGTMNGGPDPYPVHVTVTELNADCTGKYQYDVNLPGIPAATIVERFILFDNGREYRSLPASIQSGIPTLSWLTVGHRIRKASDPVATCGPQTIHGTYLFTYENIIAVDPTTAFFDNVLLRLDVSMNGNFTGMLYEKLGPIENIELPVWGAITINPDCSTSQLLNVVVQGIPVTVSIRGFYFNEGKEFYGLATDEEIPYSFAEGRRISQ